MVELHRSGILLCCRELLSASLLREELDLEPLDARAVDVEDLEPHAVVQDLVPLLGRAPELAEDEAGDRVVVLLRQVGLELLVEVVDRERAVDPDVTLVDRSTDSSGRSYSSSISPTISSSRSSSVTIPWNDAVLVDDERHVLVRRRNSASIAARSFVSGTTWAGRIEPLDDDVVDPAL